MLSKLLRIVMIRLVVRLAGGGWLVGAGRRARKVIGLAPGIDACGVHEWDITLTIVFRNGTLYKAVGLCKLLVGWALCVLVVVAWRLLGGEVK
jgi:hypothetical protein